MKRCSACGEVKPFAEFMWRKKATGDRDSYCRPCRVNYKRSHYAANQERYVRNAGAYTAMLLLKRTNWLLDYFEDHPCVDCGESDPVVLEFDHLRDKDFDIGVGIRSKNWEVILAEVEKCDVVCANCHRRRTAYRGGFARADVAQLVEHDPSKVVVASSSLVVRSKN